MEPLLVGLDILEIVNVFGFCFFFSYCFANSHDPEFASPSSELTWRSNRKLGGSKRLYEHVRWSGGSCGHVDFSGRVVFRISDSMEKTHTKYELHYHHCRHHHCRHQQLPPLHSQHSPPSRSTAITALVIFVQDWGVASGILNTLL